jgi:deoxyribodipyrimidine photolyase-related protein
MEGDDPAGGRWNFDSENRKPAARDLLMPRPRRTTPDPITQDVLTTGRGALCRSLRQS